MLNVKHDYHLHTKLSPCSGDPEATIQNYARFFADKGFSSICIMDHYWTRPENIRENNPDVIGPYPETLKQILENKKMVESTSLPITVLVGAEIETYSPDCIGGSQELKEMLDLVALPTDHFHLKDFVQQPDDTSYAGWGRHLLKFFLAGAKSRLGNILVHPFIPMGASQNFAREILDTIMDNELFDAFATANESGNAIEINGSCMANPIYYEAMVRVFSIAKKAGCKFTFGSDAHTMNELKHYDSIEKICAECGITAADVSSIML